MATISPARLSLAAGGQASAQVTVDVRGGPPGRYSGAVVATPASGRAVHVPLGFYKEPERYDLTLKAVGRDGRPATFADAGVMNVDDGSRFADFVLFDEDASVTLRVAPGHYHVMGFVVGGRFDNISMVGDPEIRVTGDTTFTLDARKAKPVSGGLEGVATDPSFVELSYSRLDDPGGFALSEAFDVGPDVARKGLFAEPTDPVRVGRFEVEYRVRLLPAGVASSATTPRLWDLLRYDARVPDPPNWVLSAAEQARLARVTAHYRNLNDHANYSDVRVGFAPLQFFSGGAYEPIAVPRTRVEYVSQGPVFWFHDASWDRGEMFIDFLGPTEGPFPPGQATEERWFGAPLHAMGYGDRGADWLFAGVADLRDSGGHNGYPFEFSDHPVAVQAFRLYRNGRLLGSATDPFLQVTVPAAAARYRMERDLDLDGLMGLANLSRTRWWFTSASPGGQDPYGQLPLLDVDYQAAPLGGRSGAVAGQPVTVDLAVARQEGAETSPVVATYLWFSTDDGTTWRQVRLRRVEPGHYRGVLPGSRLGSGTWVSLRTWARDAGNSRIHQQLIRAFPVR
jgi:hypothetical protein